MFSNYLRSKEAVVDGVPVKLNHGGEALLREHNCPAMQAAMIDAVKTEALAENPRMQDVPFRERQRIDDLAFIRGCVVGLYDPDSHEWLAPETIEALLTDPVAHVLLAELKQHARDERKFRPSKKKTNASSEDSKDTCAPSKRGGKNTRSTAKAGPTSISSGSGQEILDVPQHA